MSLSSTEPLSQSMDRNLSPCLVNRNMADESYDSTFSHSTSNVEVELNDAVAEQPISSIQVRLTNLELLVEQLKKENQELKNKQRILNKEFYDIWDRLYDNEVNIYDLNQYNRRENIVISGISESIGQRDLEKYVIDNLRYFGVHGLSSYEIVACHRLQNKRRNVPANVIVRFVNRKRAYESLDKFYHYKQNNRNCSLNIFENLCPYYQKLFSQCRKLKFQKKIVDTYTYEGKIFITMLDKQKKKIYHQHQLDELFPDLNT